MSGSENEPGELQAVELRSMRLIGGSDRLSGPSYRLHSLTLRLQPGSRGWVTELVLSKEVFHVLGR